MAVLDPAAPLQDFDAWHAAMHGPEAHEQMRQRRLDAELARAFEGGRTVRLLKYGPRPGQPETIQPADGAHPVTHVVALGAHGEVLAIEPL